MERTQDFIFTKDIQETEEEYTHFETCKAALLKKLQDAERSIREGRGISAEQFFAEMEEW